MWRTLQLLVAIAGLAVLAMIAHGLSTLSPRSPADDPLGFASPPVIPDLLSVGTSFGLLLFGGWFAGKLAKQVRLPSLTGYLLFGVIVGPSVLGMVRTGELVYLRQVDDLAVSLIALTAGGEIRFAFLKEMFRAITLLSISIVLVVGGGLVGIAMMLIPFTDWLDEPTTKSVLAVAIPIGLVGASCSPAVAIAMIAELRSRGPMSRVMLALVVLHDLVIVLLFAFSSAAVVALGMGALSAEDSGTSVPLSLLWHIGGSIVAGLVAGTAMSWYLHRVRVHLPIFLVLTAFGLALLSHRLHLEPLIVALVAGILMRNVWTSTSEILFETVEDLSLPVYCIFFAVAGAKVRIDVILDVWKLALVLVVSRVMLVCVAGAIGTRLAGLQKPVRGLLWTGLVSRAGVSIALAGLVSRQFEDQELGLAIFNVILATIAIDELIGPLLMKFGLMRAGEAGGGKEAHGAAGIGVLSEPAR